MKQLFVPVLLACGLAGGAPSGFGGEDLVPDDVVLLVGQSNMAGRAAIEDEDRGAIEGALLWNSGEGKWEAAEAPLNRHSKHRKEPGMQRLNPGVGFAKAYLKANPGRTLGIVCSARGGTAIGEWERGKPLFEASVEAAHGALAKGGKLVGILWHQGESDSGKAAGYPAKLSELVAGYRAEFEDGNLPFVFGEIGRWSKDYAAFNRMIVEQPKAIARTACVSAEGLTAFDSAHFDSRSQRELGRRYAEALGGLLEKE